MNKTIESMYDELIADHYDLDRFELYSESRKVAFNQINKNVSKENAIAILDLALGTGQMFVQLRDIFPAAKFSGIDISKKMLAIAQKKMEINTFHDDAKNIGKYVQANTIDLLLIHFLLAYISPEKIFGEASRLLKKGGFCSIATSTYQSFPILQRLASSFISEHQINQAQVPQSPDALKSLLSDAGLEIVETDIVRKKVTFADFNELCSWGIQSGWLTQYFENTSPEILGIVSANKDIFPIEDEYQGTIILAQKV